MLLDGFLLLVITAFMVVSLNLVVNIFAFPRLTRVAASQSGLPELAVLIPARDEAAVIGQTVTLLAAQDYPGLEIIVMDDQSSDATAEIARAAGATVMKGLPLPEGWSGKNWACHQLADATSAEYLLFTDADVQWNEGAVRALVAEAQKRQADLLTVWPTQITESWSERLCVPLIALVIWGYLPIWAVHHAPFAALGAANGQCMLWKRSAYQQVGGHAGVRATVLDDVTLARRVKQQRLRLRMIDGAGLIRCRMYTNWAGVQRGFAKNILAGYGGLFPLLLGTVFHWSLFLFPWIWLPFAVDPMQPLILAAWGIIIRALSAAATGQRVIDSVAMPVSAILMSWIAGLSAFWQISYGGPQWKGRILPGTSAGEITGKYE